MIKIIRKLLRFYIWPVIPVIIIATFSCIDDDPVEDEIDYTPEREAAIISDFIDTLISNGNEVDTSEMGIYYVIFDEGEGEFAQSGDSIGVIYIGFFPESGDVFDASDYYMYPDGIWKYRFMTVDMISGFNEAISLLNTGAEGLFLIPSEFAYGSTGSADGTIPPYSPLAYGIKLVNIYE